MLTVYSKTKDGSKKLTENFRVREFACKDGSDPVFIHTDLVDLLQQIRNHFKKPVVITSGYRTPPHNKQCGGVLYSQHLYGMAADIQISGVTPEEVAQYAETILKDKGGIGIYSNFTHVDIRTKKSRWRG